MTRKRSQDQLHSAALDARKYPARGPGAVFPVSFAQQRLWLIDKLEPCSPLFNVAQAFRLTGALDIEVLRRALCESVRRHAILRTRFATDGAKLLQVIGSETPAPLCAEGLDTLPEDSREEAARHRLWNEWAIPFDLKQGPLFRVRLFRLGPNDHWLMLTWHHIIADAWSGRVLQSEVSALYNAYHRGRPYPLPALPLQYGDYVLWQRQLLQGEMLAEQLAYWTGTLANLPALELPTDRPRQRAPGHRAGRVALRLGNSMTSALKALSRREGVTLFMTILAAYQVFLARHTGQDDIAVGAPITGRLRREWMGSIGLFANTLVLRTNTSGNPAFLVLLHRVRDVCLGAYSRRELPFEQLVLALKPKRILGRNPLFDVRLNLSPSSEHRMQLDDVDVEDLEFDAPLTAVDLTLSLTEIGGELTGRFEYDAELFDEPTIERMAGRFATLLEGIVAAPETPIGILPLLNSQEQEQLLVDGNARCVDYPCDPFVHRLVEQQAGRGPTAIAVEYEGTSLTYAELNARANQLAHYLRTLGVGPDVLIGVCLERSLDLVVALLAILKAGGAYVPLDPAHPAARIAFMLADTRAPVVLTQDTLRDRLPADAGRVLCVDRDAPAWSRTSVENPAAAARPEHLAYVIYTSGSTGNPKGVMVTRANVARLFSATQSWFRFGNADVWTCFHSYAFDFSVWEIWGALVYGGRLVMVPHATSRNPDAFHALLRQQKVTVLNQTPSAFRQLIAADMRADGESPLALRWVILGGEALDMAALRPWIERHGDNLPQLINMYGITETTVHVTCRSVREADAAAPKRSAIGRPIGDLRVHLLDPLRQLVPIGVAGEICVGGAGVARGYLNCPELDEERFIPDPFSGVPGARLYRSGDVGRCLPNGELEYIGRLDHQVKLRGFRIELGEIEATLTQLAGVREAAVLLREDVPGDPRLVAYVGASAAIPESELRSALMRKLPDYMLPSAYVQLPALRLTLNGKIDRNALPAPRPKVRKSYRSPRTPLEHRLGEIWADVFDAPRIGIDDNFFDLGGDSLLAAAVVTRLTEEVGVELPLRALFEAPTLGELATRIAGFPDIGKRSVLP